MWQYVYTDELYHYGVLGMKWGIRKARKRAAKEGVTGRSVNSTGKNYDETVKSYRNQYDTVMKTQGKQANKSWNRYTKAKNKFDKEFNRSADSGDSTKLVKAEKKLNKAERANNKTTKSYEKTLSDLDKSFVKDLNTAVLKDIDYKKVEKGVKYLEQRGIDLGDAGTKSAEIYKENLHKYNYA